MILSTNTTADDQSWDELGLYDFVMTNQQIGCHCYNNHSQGMLESQHGLFNRGLEPWDTSEDYSNILEVLMAYCLDGDNVV